VWVGILLLLTILYVWVCILKLVFWTEEHSLDRNTWYTKTDFGEKQDMSCNPIDLKNVISVQNIM
jgi:hypothetical protein